MSEFLEHPAGTLIGKCAASLLPTVRRTEAKQGIFPQRDGGWLRFDTRRVGENSQVSRVASGQSAAGVVQVNTEERDCSKDKMALGRKNSKKTNMRLRMVVNNFKKCTNFNTSW